MLGLNQSTIKMKLTRKDTKIMTNTINEQDFIEYLKTRDEFWINHSGQITYSEYFDSKTN